MNHSTPSVSPLRPPTLPANSEERSSLHSRGRQMLAVAALLCSSWIFGSCSLADPPSLRLRPQSFPPAPNYAIEDGAPNYAIEDGPGHRILQQIALDMRG